MKSQKNTFFSRLFGNSPADGGSLSSDRFVEGLLKYSMQPDPQDEILNRMLEFLGKESGAEGVYIYEKSSQSILDISCRWEKTPDTSGVEDHIDVKEDIKSWAESQPSDTRLVTPLMIDGEYIGALCIDGPEKESLHQLRDSRELIAFFISVNLREKKPAGLSGTDKNAGSATHIMSEDDVDSALSKLAESAEHIGVVVCDINGLEQANDTLGHDTGDAIINDVALALADVFGKDAVFRIGGDTFLSMSDADEAGFADKTEMLKVLLAAKGRTASIGMAWGDSSPESLAGLRKAAEESQQEDKRNYYKKFPGKDRRKR